MIGFILAAGFGTRLKPLTDRLPKALVPVCGEPLLAHNLRRLQKSGVFSVFGVNSHYLHDQMERFQQNSAVPFKLFYESEKIRGTGGALDFAREFLAGDDAFLVANVDILHKFDIAELAGRFMKEKRICSLVSIPATDGGTILYDSVSGDFLGVGSQGDTCPQACEARFTGVTFYRREFLDFVNKDDFSIIPVWQRAAQSKHVPGILAPEKSASWWMDIGTHEALAKIQSDVNDGVVDLWN
ncbi:MAG: NTP transferase domain-containing protein [Chitinispirillales bacterium]|jgi:NDP-sugar pyrophosphorylase family protein|nr:NTP transferase domain-containing protein [Chitinispirillales bacterium]